MGIAFITAKAERYKHRRDAAFEEQMASGDLLSKQPEATKPTYRCKSLVTALPEIGTPVLLYRTPGAINVFHLNLPIGSVMSPDSTELDTLMVQSNSDVLAAWVTELRPITAVFLVRLQRPTS